MVKKKYVCIPRSSLVINVCNQGKTLAHPVIIMDKFNLEHFIWCLCM
jgi:hypothetical protein